MKKVKWILTLIIVIIGVLFLFGTNKVYAATIQVQAQTNRPYSDDDSDGTAGNDSYALKTNIMVKLYEQNRGSTFSPTFPDAIYCMRGSLGFGYNGFLNNGNPLSYDLIGNMYANSSAVLTQYNKIITGTGGVAMTTANYNAILWIINQMYLPRNANAADLRTQLLTDAGISTSSSMTADDIEIVQQAAIWYFSNYDTNGQATSVSLDQTSATPVELTNVLQINGVQISAGTTGRYADMNTLYTYLVSQAKANSSAAPSPTITAPTLTVSKALTPAITTTQSTVTTLGSPFYIIGPFNITSSGNITDTNLVVTPAITYNGNLALALDTAAMGASGLVNAYISDANGNQIVQGGNKVYDMADMVGKGQFYIAVRQAGATSSITAFNFKINYTYSYFNTTVADFYVSSANMTSGTYTDQPLLVVEKTKMTGNLTDNVAIASGSYNIEIDKRDTNPTGALITNNHAVFSVSPVTSGVAGTAVTYDTTTTGTVIGSNIAITSDGQKFTYLVHEGTVPTGYTGASDFYITVTTGLSTAGTAYEVKSVAVSDVNGNAIATPAYLSVTATAGKVTVNVANTKITGSYNIEIDKRDTTPSGALITNNHAVFSVSPVTSGVAGTAVTYDTTTTGTVIGSNIAITSNGQKFTYLLHEGTVPTGYTGASDFYITVTTGLSTAGTAYEVKSVVVSDLNGNTITTPSYLSVTATAGKVTVNVANTKITGSYNIEIDKRDTSPTGALITNNHAVFSVSPVTAGVAGTAVTYDTTTTGTVIGSNIAITSDGQKFTYLLHEGTVPTGYTGASDFYITVTTGLSTAGTAYEVKSVVVSDVNGNAIATPAYLSVSATAGKVTVNVANTKIVGSYNIEIDKRDGTPAGALITNNHAVFNVSPVTAGVAGTAVTYDTTTTGTVIGSNIAITSDGQKFTYLVHEGTVPTGYTGVSDFYITVTTGLSTAGTAYEVKSVVVSDLNGNTITTPSYLSVTATAGKVTVNVANTKITGSYNIEIDKRDTTPAGALITNNHAVFSVSPVTAGVAGTAVTYDTTTTGTVIGSNIAITSNGQKFTYLLHEGTVPTGYTGVSDFYITVTTGLSTAGTAYEVKSVAVSDVNGNAIATPAYLSVSATAGKVTVNVANTKITGSYNIEIDKRDTTPAGALITNNHAVFSVSPVTAGVAGTAVTYDTTTTGTVAGSNIAITTDGQKFTYLLHEGTVPTGYTGASDFYITVITGLSTAGTAYEVKSVVVSDVNGNAIATPSYLSVSATAGKVTVNVANTKIVGSFHLELDKIDETGQIVTSGSAGFDITPMNGLSGATSTYYTTVDNTANGTVTGKIILPTINLNASNYTNKFTYKVTETKAPSGYDVLAGTFYITATAKQSGGSYVMDSVYESDAAGNKLTTGTSGVDVNTTTGITTVENRIITGSFHLELDKIDETGQIVTSGSAGFDITPLNGLSGATSTYYTTADNTANGTVTGKIILPTINLNASNYTNKFTYKVTETKAPSGYDALAGTFYITATAKQSGSSYVMDSVYESDASGNKLTTGTSGVDVNTTTGITTVENRIITGSFHLELDKIDETGQIVTSGSAGFDITPLNGLTGAAATYYTTADNTANGTVTGKIVLPTINLNASNYTNKFTYKVTETKAPSGYDALAGTFYITATAKQSGSSYVMDSVYESDAAGNKLTTGTSGVDVNTTTGITTVENRIIKAFDLSLRKFITSINGTAPSVSRVPVLDTSKLEDGTDTTATYTHPKDALPVNTSDTVLYTIRIYNEGELSGTATEVTDYLPAGLKLKPGSTINSKYGWTENAGAITSAYLASQPDIPAFDPAKNVAGTNTNWQKSAVGASGLYYADLQVECIVVANVTMQNQGLRNVAEITADNSPSGSDDRDSVPNNVDINKYNNGEMPADNSKWQEDDDDYEQLILPGKIFDLSLQKWISDINGAKPSPDRTPKIDLSKLNTIGTDGKEITTAEYAHPQDAVTVKQGDIVTFTVRVYNEGDRDGYASQIKDQIPAGLGLLLNYKTNYDNRWAITSGSSVQDLVGANGFYQNASSVKNLKVSDFVASDGTPLASFDGVQIVKGASAVTTDILKYDSLAPEANVIKGYDPSKVAAGTDTNWQAADVGGSGLYYRDVQITCIVLAPNTSNEALTNVAQISKAQNENGGDMNNPGDDRDSVPDNNIPTEDDQDHDQVQLRYFDLSLKKFISSVITSGGVAASYDRVPVATIPDDFLNPRTDLTYTFSKEKAQNPVNVVPNDTVVYTIRIYNEGTEAGYANEIRDNVPAGLEYIPTDSINQKYGWQMYDSAGAVTTDPTKAVEMRTAYLSQGNGTQNELKPFDAEAQVSTADPKNPDYKDVQIAFKVLDTGNKDPKNVIINIAEISKDSGDDIDSTPNNNQPGEDDQNNEYIHLQQFDLALIKYVDSVAVTINGNTTTTQYQMPSDDAGSEYLVKADLGKTDISQASVKFTYTLEVTNTGEVAGSAQEITDKVPDWLQFVAADNPQWTEVGENTVTTNALNGTVLQPGQSATVPITLTWVNGGTNTGVEDNVAVITGFYNESGSPDSNSNNNKDNALVIITLKTGGAAAYIPLIAGVLAILGSGVFLIKRYVI